MTNTPKRTRRGTPRPGNGGPRPNSGGSREHSGRTVVSVRLTDANRDGLKAVIGREAYGKAEVERVVNEVVAEWIEARNKTMEVQWLPMVFTGQFNNAPVRVQERIVRRFGSRYRPDVDIVGSGEVAVWIDDGRWKADSVSYPGDEPIDFGSVEE